ncbi:hypothetical protein [Mucilaginibacter antarcticus]|uniref:hypothetical protein n=1 Tax=Mucilaginibacter antarcticus TaxID=1855725 RepID=UPI00362E1721
MLNRGRTFAAVQVIQTPVTKPVEKPGAIPIPPPVIKPAAPAGKDSVVNNNVVAAPPVTKPVDVTAPGQEPQVVIPQKEQCQTCLMSATAPTTILWLM